LLIFSFLVLSPLWVSFGESILIQGRISLSAYREILTDKRLLPIFTRTILIGAGTAISALLVGLPFAFILERIRLPFKKIFNAIYFLPVFIPAYIQGFTWINLMEEKKFLRDFFIQIRNLTSLSFNLYSIKGVIFILTLSFFPFVVLFIITGLRAIDRRLEEAGELIGSRFNTLIKITLPLILPYIFTSLAFVFILTISEYALPELLRTYNYAFEVYYQFDAFHNFAKATALAFPPTVLTVSLVFLMAKFMSERPYVSISGHYRPAQANKFPILRIPALLFVSGILFLSLICPILVLVKGIGPLKNILFAFDSSLSEIVLSLFLAVLGATLCTFISLPMAYLLENSRGISRKLIDLITLIPLAIPGPIIGLGLIKLWNRPQTFLIYSSFISILLAYLARFACFGIRIISAALKTYSKEFKEAALLIPASRIRRFFKITFPLIHPSLVTTWLVSFVFCMLELSAVLFIVPPGEVTLPMRIELLLHHADRQMIFAMCLVQIMIILIPVLILLPYAKLRTRDNT